MKNYNNSPIVKYSELDLFYNKKGDKVTLFQNLNLDINQNGLIVILGESGTGKTSLLNLVAGFIKPRKGLVEVKDKIVNQMSEDEVCDYRNRKIGFIFQTFNLIPRLSALENVMLPAIIAGLEDPEEKAMVYLKKLGIDHRKDHFPSEMSGGEQQRVAIARALVNGADIILADEPTGNLDEKNTEVVKGILKDISKEGRTILVVTHDVSFRNIADQIVEMDKLRGI